MNENSSQELFKKIETLEKRLRELESRVISRKIKIGLLIVACAVIPLVIYAATITKPYNFNPGTVASSSEINDNFDTLYDKVNQLDSAIEGFIYTGSLWQLNGSKMYYNDGNIGIYTNTPNRPLQVNSPDHESIRINEQNNVIGDGGGIEFAAFDSSFAKIYGNASNLTGGQESGHLYFQTRNNGTYNTNMVILNSGNVGIGTTTPGATLQVDGTMKIFGARISRSVDTTYQAATDGIVTVRMGAGWDTAATWWGYVGFANPPTSIITTCRLQYDSAFGVYTDRGTMTFPVRKGEYWKVERDAINGEPQTTIYWMPMGN